MTELSVATTIVGDECVLTLIGEIDMSCSYRIGDLGVGTLESHGIRRLVVDLSEVTFIDSTGLNALVRMNQAASAQDKLLLLRNPSERVRKMLSMTALDTVLPIEYAAAPHHVPARRRAPDTPDRSASGDGPGGQMRHDQRPARPVS